MFSFVTECLEILHTTEWIDTFHLNSRVQSAGISVEHISTVKRRLYIPAKVNVV